MDVFADSSFEYIFVGRYKKELIFHTERVVGNVQLLRYISERERFSSYVLVCDALSDWSMYSNPSIRLDEKEQGLCSVVCFVGDGGMVQRDRY